MGQAISLGDFACQLQAYGLRTCSPAALLFSPLRLFRRDRAKGRPNWSSAFTAIELRSAKTRIIVRTLMLTFLIWCVLFILCWPLAILALVAYPIVWLLLLPFRIVGIAVGGALSLVWGIVTLPFRIISGGFRRLA